MKIKILFFVVAAGMFLASCSDKEAATKLADMEKAMKAADSTCLAEKTMLMDSIMSMQTAMDEMKDSFTAPGIESLLKNHCLVNPDSFFAFKVRFTIPQEFKGSSE